MVVMVVIVVMVMMVVMERKSFNLPPCCRVLFVYAGWEDWLFR